MIKIFILLHPECSHFGASLFTAKRLQEGGREVVYLCIERDREYLEKNGMSTIVFMKNTFPEGFRSRMATIMPPWRRRSARRFMGGLFSEMSADLDRLIETHKPDLFLVDTIIPFGALVPMSHKVPVILFNTFFPLAKDGDVPPLFTTLQPPANDVAKREVARKWKKYLRFRNFAHKWLGVSQQYLSLAEKRGIPLEALNRECYFMFDLPLPQIILAPRELDFQRPHNPDHHYVGACIDPERTEIDFPWDRLSDDKRLVYASFGEEGFTNKKVALRVFESLIQAVGEMNDAQLVLTTAGMDYQGELLGKYPNVVLVRKAPQLGLLRRAAVMVTHAGLNSVKECLYHGVPMLAFPIRIDQKGNAARIAHHGLGELGDAASVDAESLRARLASIMDDSGIRKRVDNMRTRFTESDETKVLNQLVDNVLSGNLAPRKALPLAEPVQTQSPIAAHNG